VQKKHLKRLLGVVMAALLVIVTGCQAVGGVDVAKVLTKGMEVTSSESNLSLSVDLIPSGDVKLSGKQLAIIELVKSMKLTFDSVKAQDQTHVSAKGNLSFDSVKIPLQFAMNDKAVTVHIDGMSKPLEIPLVDQAALSDMPAGMMKQIQDSTKTVAPLLIEYLIKNFPDMKVDVNQANETINGESLNLTKIHLELSGDQLIPLLKQLLNNIAKDEEGLKELVGKLYDALLPVIKEAVKGQPGVEEIVKNKELAVSFVVPMVKDFAANAVKELNPSPTELAVLKGISIKMDYYIDSNLDIRRNNVELSVMLPSEQAESGIKGFTVKASSDTWNINKPVQADAINTSKGTLKPNNLSIEKFVANLDKNSAVYKLLKDELGVTQKNIKLVLSDSESEAGAGNGQPYLKNDWTMVPTRFVMEQLGAELDWDADTEQITVMEYLTGKTLVMHVGSNVVKVNGVEREMPVAVETQGGWSFVPLRYIATEFGFVVDWNEESQIVSILRD